MGKFATNNNESASIKLFPFFAIQAFYHYMSFDIIDFFNTNTHERIFKSKALDIFGKIETMW